MLATVHVLHLQPSVIGGLLRVGHPGYRRLGELHAAGKLNFNRFVFDAAHIDKQVELLKALKVAKLVNDAKKRLIRLRDALGDLHAKESVSTWSGPLTFRGRSRLDQRRNRPLT